jgi:hypothetical protein
MGDVIMVMFAQGMLLLVVAAGIVFVLFLKYYAYLVVDANGMPARQESESVSESMSERRIAERTAFAQIERTERQEETRLLQQHSMFEFHQERIRRYYDAKFEVIRSINEVHSRIAIINAGLARSRMESELRMIEYGQKARVEHGDEEAGREMALLDTTRRIHEEQMLLQLQQQEAVKADAERRLAMLDQEMRAMPGASVEGWVSHQLLESACTQG